MLIKCTTPLLFLVCAASYASPQIVYKEDNVTIAPDIESIRISDSTLQVSISTRYSGYSQIQQKQKIVGSHLPRAISKEKGYAHRVVNKPLSNHQVLLLTIDYEVNQSEQTAVRPVQVYKSNLRTDENGTLTVQIDNAQAGWIFVELDGGISFGGTVR